MTNMPKMYIQPETRNGDCQINPNQGILYQLTYAICKYTKNIKGKEKEKKCSKPEHNEGTQINTLPEIGSFFHKQHCSDCWQHLNKVYGLHNNNNNVSKLIF